MRERTPAGRKLLIVVSAACGLAFEAGALLHGWRLIESGGVGNLLLSLGYGALAGIFARVLYEA